MIARRLLSAGLRPSVVSLGVLAVTVALGCGGSSAPSFRDVNDTNIKKLRGAYGLFTVRHDLRGPKSEGELKDFIRSDAGAVAKMKEMGVDLNDIDAIFVSERDGKPFRVRYGLNGLGDHAMVFEEEGVEGKRMVALNRVREVGDDEYQALWTQERPSGPNAGEVFAE